MKTKNLFILVFIILMINGDLFGQDEQGFHFGGSIMPQYNTPRFNNSEINVGKSTLGWSAQLDISYELGTKIQFESGIGFRMLEVTTIDYSIAFACDFMGNSADSFNSWTEDRQDISYAKVPIFLRTKLFGDVNSLYSRIGGTAFFFSKEHKESAILECGENELSIATNLFNRPSDFIFTINLGIGYETQFTNDIKLFIEPQVGYTLTDIFEDVNITSNFTDNIKVLDFGLRFGIRY